MVDKNIFSIRLKELRKSRGLTQSQLGKAIDASFTRIGNWEQGVAVPPLDTATELADYFNVSLDYLVGRSDEPAPPKK